MTRPVVLAHGWGFDRSLWDQVALLLPELALFRVEAGYLGAAPHWPEVPDGSVLVGHSAGVPSLLLHPSARSCAGLVSINGFSRFAAGEDFPGIPERLLIRMEHGLAAAPGSVLRDFRQRCGDTLAPVAPLAPGRLRGGLELLRMGDARAALAGFEGQVLALAAEDDPIVLPAHTRACFASRQLHWCRIGGHLLPLTRPDRCAALIRAVAC